MSPFQRLWTDHAARLGLTVVVPFSVPLGDPTITVPVLLRQFGAREGMLLVTDFEPIRPHADRLVRMGYGYSCLDDCGHADEGEDEETLIEMLRDWGWSGGGAPPAWLHGGGR